MEPENSTWWDNSTESDDWDNSTTTIPGYGNSTFLDNTTESTEDPTVATTTPSIDETANISLAVYFINETESDGSAVFALQENYDGSCDFNEAQLHNITHWVSEH